jgi:hypothetical protein
MEEDAQFVAVVGLFNRPDMQDNRWRLVLTHDDLDPDKARVIELGEALDRDAALYVPSAGEGSANVSGRDEFWFEEKLWQKALTGAKTTTRVRCFWRHDEQGNMRVYGVHTG